MTPSHLHSWLASPLRRPLVMGILNVTPDSFSDGGRFADSGSAVQRGIELATEGADLIDVGGESTRPRAEPVGADEQIRRVVPVIQGLRESVPAVISIDTGLAQVAEAALDAGADVINDVYAGTADPHLLQLAAGRGAPVVLMHMRGRPATMQDNPQYADVTTDVIAFLKSRIEAAIASGIVPHNILIDPGIGFGKTARHNLQLLRQLPSLRTLGKPIVLGVSRKAFIEGITGESVDSGRPLGTAAAVAWSIAHGADIVRVHDVGPMSQVVRMIEAIQTEKSN